MALPPIIAVFNAKGGVGKTTTVVNLATCLAAYGRKILVIDMDAQGNATTSFAQATLPAAGTYDLLTGRMGLAEVVMPSLVDGVSLVGATDDMGIIDVELAVSPLKHGVLRSILAELPEGAVDLVLVDCPPAIGAMTVNALLSAHAVIVPANPTPFAHDGLMRTWKIVKRLHATLNPGLFIQGVLLTLADAEGEAEWSMERVMQAELGDLVYDLRIGHDPKVFVAAAGHGLPAVIFDPTSEGARQYLDLAEIVLEGEPRLRRAVQGLASNPPPVPARSRAEAENALAAWHGMARERGLLDASLNVPELGDRLPPPVFSDKPEPSGRCSTAILVTAGLAGAVLGAGGAMLAVLLGR
jgi:chromosome partitioning protein